MTPMLSTMLNLLKMRNPQRFSDVNQAIQAGQDPRGFAKQLFGNMDANQKEQILKQARSMGAPENILSQIQNMK